MASAFKLVNKIVEEENLVKDYNIYVFYGGDGEDWDDGQETIDELKKIVEKGKGKHKSAAKVALQLVKKKNIGVIKTKEGHVDELILGLLGKDCVLATQDELLRKKAVKKGIKVIVLRSKKYLVLK